MFYEESVEGWGLSAETLSPCPHQCDLTVDKSLFPLSDAVVYHGWPEGGGKLSLHSSMYPLPRPRRRRADQAWVYLMMEPPAPHYSTYDTLGDHHDFNWTMTYRKDSDIHIPYGFFEELPSDPDSDSEPPDPDPLNKTSLVIVAGMISECGRGSGRDAYIAQLRKYISVDLYGKCGELHCSKTENCYKILSAKYKFWLSFENARCADYVSEKFFRPLEYGMVPVYLGHPNGPSSVQAPPGSYIHTKDFKDPEALAKYLGYLDRNPAEYSKYFEWKRRFRLGLDTIRVAWCTLCTKLNRMGEIESGKSYRRIADWFLRNNTESSLCLPPNFV
jgi:hypothetical protein